MDREMQSTTLISDPDWASLNLGVLMCIECSGVHRQLGSHISRVRSLDLDEWPPGHIAVMAALGNKLANGVFEGKLAAAGIKKPDAASPQTEKERFIQAKYQYKQLVSPLPAGSPGPAACLIDGICR
jgi:Arf-GAP/GTPase/ANK repeat/PH domain-containing protein 1/3